MRAVCLALLLCSTACVQAQNDAAPLRNHDPDAAIVMTEDMTRFWQAYDHWVKDLNSAPSKLPTVLQQQYLDPGSQGVKDFIPHRIESAEYLSQTVLKNRAYYESVRRNNELIQNALPEIHNYFRELKRLYPDAVFPPVYFVIGALDSGGTSSEHGLIIGAEMLSEQNRLNPTTDAVGIVMHELMHFQQKHPDDDLLDACLREGSADFIAELVSGHNLNGRNKVYGDSHEEELWQKFQNDMKKTDRKSDWLYNYDQKGRVGPPDLGYYMGYKISQSLYQSATNKAAALRLIIEMRDPGSILATSAYGKRFSNQTVQ
jgi:hypothetical protein